MNEQDMAKRITRHLNHGANQMDRSMLERLQLARKQALAVHTNPQQVFGMSIAGHGGLHSGHHGQFSLRFWLSLVVLLLGLLTIFSWQDNSAEPDDVDATLLAGELPVHAFLDSDFNSWLDQSLRR